MVDNHLDELLRNLDKISEEQIEISREKTKKGQILELLSIPLLLGILVCILSYLLGLGKITLADFFLNFGTGLVGTCVTVFLFDIIWKNREDEIEKMYQARIDEIKEQIDAIRMFANDSLDNDFKDSK